jgi:hypothetical protein
LSRLQQHLETRRKSIMKLSLALLLAAACLSVGIYLGGWVSAPQTFEDGAATRAYSGDAPRAAADHAEKAAGRNLEIRDLSGQVARLNAQVSAIERQLRGMSRTVAYENPRVEEGRHQEPANDPVARAEAESRRREQMEAVEASFRQEASDPRWSADVTATVQGVLASKEAASIELRGLECRSSTCRIEIVDDGNGKLAMAMPLFILHLGRTLPHVVVDHIDDGDGAKVMILYMSRS